jgi:hypothetical protein
VGAGETSGNVWLVYVLLLLVAVSVTVISSGPSTAS